MSKSRLSLTKPVKMLTIVAHPDPSLRPAASELVPWRTRMHLSCGRAQRVAQACAQQAAGMIAWLRGTSRTAWDVAQVIREGTSRAIRWIRPRSGASEERLRIAASSALEAVPHDTDLVHEVRMLRAQVQAQNKILAELTYVLLDERKRVRETDQLIGHYDRQSESRLLRVLEENASAEESWGNSKLTSARVIAD
jgi:hypothetical protein